VTGRPGWLQRRREKIRAEVERNRRGGHRVPTWVLVVILVAVVAAWTALVVWS
jgi:fatty acid desaturase